VEPFTPATFERVLRLEPLIPSDIVTLPVGFCKPGDESRYREVHIDELSGTDEELVAKGKVRRNQSLTITKILSRCVQGVPGLLQEKTNPQSQYPEQTVKNWLTQYDRDFLLVSILALSGKSDTIVRGYCGECDIPLEEEVQFSDLEVYDWPVDAPLEIQGTLPRGYTDALGTVHQDFTLRFVTGALQEQVLTQAGGNAGKASTLFISSCMTQLGTLDAVDIDIAASLRSIDRQFIGNLRDVACPGIMLMRKLECEECGRVYDRQLDLSGFFVEAWKSMK
jgi:hypothetical protein